MYGVAEVQALSLQLGKAIAPHGLDLLAGEFCSFWREMSPIYAVSTLCFMSSTEKK
jgi:hypothetical protein